MEYWLQGEVDKVFVHSSVFKNREVVPCLYTYRNDPVERESHARERSNTEMAWIGEKRWNLAYK